MQKISKMAISQPPVHTFAISESSGAHGTAVEEISMIRIVSVPAHYNKQIFREVHCNFYHKQKKSGKGLF